MENLNAEKVVKGLECCSADTTDCNNCPYSEFSEGNCFDNAKKDALALIKELTEEKERLRAIPEQMKERLQAYFGTYVLGYKIPLSEALKAVNQIAKEILEDQK